MNNTEPRHDITGMPPLEPLTELVEAESSPSPGGRHIRSDSGRNGWQTGFIFLSVITTLLLITVVVLVAALLNYSFVPEEDAYIPASSPSAGAGEIVDRDNIFFDSGLLGEVVIPTYADVDLSSYDMSCFAYDGDFITYVSDDAVSLIGIDVSTFQGDIDWYEVKASGVDYAMIRLGYRGYTEGGLVMDDYFRRNIAGATRAGIKVGVYFFSQALNVAEAVEEAEFVLSCIENYNVSFPVAFDWEPIHHDTARTDNMSVEALTKCALAFCRTIEEAGYTPAVYFNQIYGYFKYDLSQLTDYDLWVAQYDDRPTFYYDFTMWQYSDSGRVNGIEGDVDLNLSFVDYSAVSEEIVE